MDPLSQAENTNPPRADLLVNAMFGFLRKVCPLIHSSANLMLYSSFYFPSSNYCSIVWAASHPNHLKK